MDTMNRETYFKFDTITVHLAKACDSYKNVFSEALVFPKMIYCELDSSCNPPINNLESTGLKISVYDKNIFIRSFKEYHHQRVKPTQRRFEFCTNTTNGTGFYIFILELTNDHANKKTDLDTFIKGARVTYFRYTSAAI